MLVVPGMPRSGVAALLSFNNPKNTRELLYGAKGRKKSDIQLRYTWFRLKEILAFNIAFCIFIRSSHKS